MSIPGPDRSTVPGPPSTTVSPPAGLPSPDSLPASHRQPDRSAPTTPGSGRATSPCPPAPPTEDDHTLVNDWDKVIPPTLISPGGQRFYSQSQQAEIIKIYNTLPFGTKGTFTAINEFTGQQITRWKRHAVHRSKLAPNLTDPVFPYQISPPEVHPVNPDDYVDPDRKRDLVLAYLTQPRGRKQDFCDTYRVSLSHLNRWLAAMADGDLDKGLTPRKTGTMTTDNVEEILRLRQVITTQQQRLDTQDARINQLVDVADALGKATRTMPAATGGDSDEEENTSPSPNTTATTRALPPTTN